MRDNVALAIILILFATLSFADEVVSGDATIRRGVGDSEIVIRTTSRLAGAIDSLVWKGREFIDSADHGRQLQSACGFDAGQRGEFWAECFNPTEAGSRHDGAGATSTSRLLKLKAEGNMLETETQMAFWLRPGERSEGRLALNDKPLSNHVLRKRVTIGHGELDNVIVHEATFVVPDGERHRFAQFEALTGYMPAEFEKFRTFDPKTGELADLNDGPGEQRLPVVFSTADDAYAMGVWSPDQPSPGYEQAGYGRFRFTAEKVVKWNCVFRERNAEGIKPGERTFRTFVVVGTLEEVRGAMNSIAKEANSR